VNATLFAEGMPPAESFFGHFETAVANDIIYGSALIRFSDGSEADV
jgi:hypothetical protein